MEQKRQLSSLATVVRGAVRQRVSVDAIGFNPLNLRGFLRSPDDIERVATSIVNIGILDDPIITVTDSGYMVVAGESRVMACRYLADKIGLDEFRHPECKVLRNLSQGVAMRILSESNMMHGLVTNPAASANETYWHYHNHLQTTHNHESALSQSLSIWGGTKALYEAYIIPGWLLAHAPTVDRLYRTLGDFREGFYDADDTTRAIAEKIRKVRATWWREITKPFRPADRLSLLAPPPLSDTQEFDRLMYAAFELLEKGIYGQAAITELETKTLPLRQMRLEKRLGESDMTEGARMAIKAQLGQVISMRERRKMA